MENRNVFIMIEHLALPLFQRRNRERLHAEFRAAQREGEREDIAAHYSFQLLVEAAAKKSRRPVPREFM
jgi:hypothetical protein